MDRLHLLDAVACRGMEQERATCTVRHLHVLATRSAENCVTTMAHATAVHSDSLSRVHATMVSVGHNAKPPRVDH